MFRSSVYCLPRPFAEQLINLPTWGEGDSVFKHGVYLKKRLSKSGLCTTARAEKG